MRPGLGGFRLGFGMVAMSFGPGPGPRLARVTVCCALRPAGCGVFGRRGFDKARLCPCAAAWRVFRWRGRAPRLDILLSWCGAGWCCGAAMLMAINAAFTLGGRVARGGLDGGRGWACWGAYGGFPRCGHAAPHGKGRQAPSSRTSTWPCCGDVCHLRGHRAHHPRGLPCWPSWSPRCWCPRCRARCPASATRVRQIVLGMLSCGCGNAVASVPKVLAGYSMVLIK